MQEKKGTENTGIKLKKRKGNKELEQLNQKRIYREDGRKTANLRLTGKERN